MTTMKFMIIPLAETLISVQAHSSDVRKSNMGAHAQASALRTFRRRLPVYEWDGKIITEEQYDRNVDLAARTVEFHCEAGGESTDFLDSITTSGEIQKLIEVQKAYEAYWKRGAKKTLDDEEKKSLQQLPGLKKELRRKKQQRLRRDEQIAQRNRVETNPTNEYLNKSLSDWWSWQGGKKDGKMLDFDAYYKKCLCSHICQFIFSIFVIIPTGATIGVAYGQDLAVGDSILSGGAVGLGMLAIALVGACVWFGLLKAWHEGQQLINNDRRDCGITLRVFAMIGFFTYVGFSSCVVGVIYQTAKHHLYKDDAAANAIANPETVPELTEDMAEESGNIFERIWDFVDGFECIDSGLWIPSVGFVAFAGVSAIGVGFIALVLCCLTPPDQRRQDYN